MRRASLDAAETFEAFWPAYVRLHARPETQLAHLAGTLSCGALLVAALVTRSVALAALAPLVDYLLAQGSHRLVERNRTTPWKHPAFHARAELRMARLVLAGRMAEETRRHA